MPNVVLLTVRLPPVDGEALEARPAGSGSRVERGSKPALRPWWQTRDQPAEGPQSAHDQVAEQLERSETAAAEPRLVSPSHCQ